jgi:3-phenylpropionate/cinnamic acid dioxygenase small subunit
MTELQTMPTVSPELQLEIQDFLFREASLLEENRLEEWLALFTEDARYEMPVRVNVQPVKGAKGAGAQPKTFALFDDDRGTLGLRVRRLGTDLAHAETPVSVTQRLISNVRVEPVGDDGSFTVFSSFIVYQERRGRHSAMFLGKRRDLLRREGDLLKIAERRITLAQAVLPTTLSIFF